MSPYGPDESLRSELEASRHRFLEMVSDVRPRLHRYCSRMLGSPLDGEDAVQETLATAYFKMPVVREPRDLTSWLFRVAHNRCIDVLRRRRGWEVELEGDPPGEQLPPDLGVSRVQEVDRALHRLVVALPPKERACVVLKDVLELSLAEVAEIVQSTEGGVKAALHRGRSKLARLAGGDADRAGGRRHPPPPPTNTDRRRLLETYAQRFNDQDWPGLVELLRADARLEVLEVYDGQGHAAFTDRYFLNYSRLGYAWRYAVEAVDGVWQLVVRRRGEGGWRPSSVVRTWIEDGAIGYVRDYLHVPPYLLADLDL